MTDGARGCPGCGETMQEWTHGSVNLQLCGACGGTVLEADGLRALGIRDGVEPFEGHTERRCSFCRITMSPAFVRSVPVEVCTSCTSVFLDAEELPELAPTVCRGCVPITSGNRRMSAVPGSGITSTRTFRTQASSSTP